MAAVVVTLGLVGCTELVAPRIVAPRGEALKFHVLGNKTWTVYLRDGAIYSEKGRRLSLSPEQVKSTVKIGRAYDTLDMRIRLSGVVFPDEPSPSLSRPERIAELKRLLQKHQATLPASGVSKQGIDSKPTLDASMSAQDDEGPCSPQWRDWQAKVVEISIVSSLLQGLQDDWFMNCEPEPYDVEETPPPPPPGTPAYCAQLQDDIADMYFFRATLYVESNDLYMRWYACTTFIA
jgi:hypothetical protein